MKKIVISLLTSLFLITFVFGSVCFAGSYDSCPPVFVGFSISPNTTVSNYYIGYKTVGGLDNSSSGHSARYTFSNTITKAITLGGSYSSALSSSINVNTGAVSGGLGGKINRTINIAATYTGSYSETYSTTVPAHEKLVLRSKIYGKKVSGYAKYWNTWQELTRGTYRVKIPQYQVFWSVWS